MKNTSIKDIAKRLNISTATVSRALNNTSYASKEIKELVLKTAKEMNYIPNNVAKSLQQKKTNMVGIVVPDISNPYFLTAAKGIEDTLKSDELTLIFTSSNENVDDEKRILTAMNRQRVDVIVLATAGITNEELLKLGIQNIPIILFDRTIEGSDYSCVVEDNSGKAYQLTNQVIEQGHKDIGVVVGSLRVSTGVQRLMGVQKCFADHDLFIPKENYFYGNFTQTGGSDAADYFLSMDKKPTCILSFNNNMTIGLINRLLDLDKWEDSNITIASYGNFDLEKILNRTQYISIKQNPYEMGCSVGEIINQIVEGNYKN